MNQPNEKRVFTPSPMRQKWLAFAKKIRPWGIFFYSKNNYSLPSEKIPLERIKKNIEFLEANYIIFLVPCLILGLLGDLILMLILILSYFGWSFIQNNRKPSFFYDDHYATSDVKFGCLFLANLFLIIILTGGYLFTLIGLSVSFIVIHASFIDETLQYQAKNPIGKDEENNGDVEEHHMMFDTQIINKETYGLEVLTEKHDGLI